MHRYNLALALMHQQDLNNVLARTGRIRKFEQQSLAILLNEWRGTSR
jgi:hypothetical protein